MFFDIVVFLSAVWVLLALVAALLALVIVLSPYGERQYGIVKRNELVTALAKGLLLGSPAFILGIYAFAQLF